MESGLKAMLRHEAEQLGPRELTEFLESLLYMLAYHLEAQWVEAGWPGNGQTDTTVVTHGREQAGSGSFERCREQILLDLGASGVEAEMQRVLLDQYGPPCYEAARRILARQQDAVREKVRSPAS